MFEENLFVPDYELPDFNVIADGDLDGLNDFEAQAVFELDNYLESGYITQDEYDGNLETITNAAATRKTEITPVYTLPDFTVNSLSADGTTSELDDEYATIINDLKVNFLDKGYIDRAQFDAFQSELDANYNAIRTPLVGYTLPDFTVYDRMPELGTAYSEAFDELQEFQDNQFFEEGQFTSYFDELQAARDAAQNRIRGIYELPEFAVNDTEGTFTVDDIDELFEDYEEALGTDFEEGYLSFDDFTAAGSTAKGIYDTERKRREPIVDFSEGSIFDDESGLPPADGGMDDTDPDPDYVDYGNNTGIDTGGTISGGNMAQEFDPAYNLYKIMYGEAAAREAFPSGKSEGLADPRITQGLSEYMLGQDRDAFARTSALAEETQDLADKQRRLRRESDLGLMQEFGGQYQEQMKELYPDQAFGLQQQRAMAERAADEASGGLTANQRARAEQTGYLFGAQRGREYDPITMMKQFGEEESIRRDRDQFATNQLSNLGNMEKSLYGDLPSVIGADSPYTSGAGNITTSFDASSILDMGSVDYANQQQLRMAEDNLATLERAYSTAGSVAEKRSIFEQIGDVKNTITNIKRGVEDVKSIGGMITDLFN